MLIPEMLPDEIGRGYLGRLRAINGFQSAEETVRALRLFLGEQGRGRESTPIAVLLAKALRMPAEVFLRQHSMLPYTRAVTIDLPDMRHGAAGLEAVIRNKGMSLPQSGVYICRSCVTEDMDFWGGAYFRRSHQLPGVHCCEKHREPLLRVADEKAFYSSPYELLGRSDLEETGLSASTLDHPVINRFATISGHWLQSDRSIPAYGILRPLQKRAELFGLRRTVKGRRKLLSDLATEVVPADWLTGNFPGLTNKPPFEYFPALDIVLRATNGDARSTSYALALAILFDTVEEALNKVTYSSSSSHIGSISRRISREFWHSDEFRGLYVESRGSSRHIAEKMGIERSHASRTITAAGFPGLGHVSNASLQVCVDLVEGISITEACAKRGANRSVVERLIPFLSDRFVSTIKAILKTENGSELAPHGVEAELVM